MSKCIKTMIALVPKKVFPTPYTLNPKPYTLHPTPIKANKVACQPISY
ncbi:MAG: hypothetical protein F6K50_04540 [Moorea sp. SIO3I7]|nr:hypothetical protein [Moorena sp. SIO3I8]NEN94818.1 hypothetical protein [Moorena sp. SIO3I7]NEO08893.1 hypothetical protein [Moorena sp. SIO3I8]